MKKDAKNVMVLEHPQPRQKKKDVRRFRSLKKMLFGRPERHSMDLLDRWIIKKRLLSLFFEL